MSGQPFKTIVLDLLQEGHHDEEVFVQKLSESERGATGTWEVWSAKDHIAHRTFWHRNLVRKLTAILQQQEVVRSEEDEEQLNAMTFEKNGLRSWADVYAESERVYAELIALIEQLSEEDLISGEERPLYTSFLGGCYEHDEEHLVQYYRDHGELARAIEMRENCANRIMEVEVPEWVKGWFLYNLACFYAQVQQVEKASDVLQEALKLAPDLKERSEKDDDLAALRD